MGHRLVAVLAAAMLVAGCAEINHRGGVVAQMADKIIFPASAKSHRVLRAYVVLASLVTIANNRGIPSGDKMAFNGRVVQTMSAIQQAFICAYSSRSGCIFFDEKMARVDYNLYKLALTVLVTSETRALITQLEGELLPKIPVVGSTLAAASSAAQAAGQVVSASVEITQIVENLIKLGYDAAVTIGPLFPLYRDAQELDMVVVVDMLARRCAYDTGHFDQIPKNKNPFRQNVHDWLLQNGAPRTQACMDFASGSDIYQSGNGDLESWRRFTNDMSKVYLADMTPSGDHFLEVSSMISAACDQITAPDGIGKASGKPTAAASACAGALIFGNTSTYPELVTAQDSANQLSYHGTNAQPKATAAGSNPVVKAKAKLNEMPL